MKTRLGEVDHACVEFNSAILVTASFGLYYGSIKPFLLFVFWVERSLAMPAIFVGSHLILSDSVGLGLVLL